ncbi:MAG TPA: F0F1 ATP synthase subunit A [Edaphocola sp.]|nr:F0F1 ATP synthase subunit A [Edaphocola sp.]
MLKNSKLFKTFILLIISGLSIISTTSFAENKVDAKKLDIKEVIFGHIKDTYDWHVLDIPGKDGVDHPIALPLPVILYNPNSGLDIFLSTKLDHGHSAYKGYQLVTQHYIDEQKEAGVSEDVIKNLQSQAGKIIALDGANIKDFSFTKNIFNMFISIAILFLIFISVARSYKKKGITTAPSGLQNAMEPLITFVRDEVAKPNLGSNYMKFMPLLLTMFFFIWLNNMLGLIPSGANFTGNIAVTGALALISFIVILFTAKKAFWSHLFNPPGVPFPVNILLTIIEILSLIIKPVALMIRLFANMLAGHIILVSLIMIIFILGGISSAAGWGFAPVSIAFTVFMYAVKLLVAAIQAFIFVNLTAVFIGQGLEDHTHPAGTDGMDHAHSEEELVM